jgi:hypothetical protein
MAGETKLALEGSQARSIAVDPLDPRRVYLGTMDSGLWFSVELPELDKRSARAPREPAAGAQSDLALDLPEARGPRSVWPSPPLMPYGRDTRSIRWSTQSAARRSRLTALGSSHAKAPTTSPTVGLRQSVFELNA